MIDDLDRTLKNLLEDPECGLPDLDPSPTITFAAPDSKFTPNPPALNLFLMTSAKIVSCAATK